MAGEAPKGSVVELSYLMAAVRRRWWLIGSLAILGGILGLLAGGDKTVAYQARAVLNIQPPQNALGGTVFISDPDRYVISQLSVLRSEGLAQRVASAHPGQTSQSIANAVSIAHEPKSDIVTIGVTLADPEEAKNIANDYVTSYIEDLKKRASAQTQTAVSDFDKRLAAIKAEVVAIEKKREVERQTISQANLVLGNPTGVAAATLNEAKQRLDTALDTTGQLDGDLQSLRAEQTQVLANQSQLQQAAVVKVASEVVQPAVTPKVAVPAGKAKLLPIAGLLGGALLGIALAMAFARLSGKALDEQDIGEALGQPVVGRMGRLSELANSSLPTLLDELPDSAAAVIDQLCVRAEARSTEGRALTVLVAGSLRPAATSTVAVALANRFAHNGLSVILVDADQASGSITREFGATKHGGIPALLHSLETANGRGRTAPVGDNGFAAFTDAPISRVQILGLGRDTDRAAIRRTDVADILHATARYAHVVVVDGGALFEAATSIQFAQMVDSVVLTVPMKSQKLNDLELIADQLGESRMKSVLPIVTHPTGSST